MITIAWFRNGTTVIRGHMTDAQLREKHPDDVLVTAKHFLTVEQALKELKPENRATPLLKRMRDGT